MPARVTIVALPGMEGGSDDEGEPPPIQEPVPRRPQASREGAADLLAKLGRQKRRPVPLLWDKVRQKVPLMIEKDVDDISNVKANRRLLTKRTEGLDGRGEDDHSDISDGEPEMVHLASSMRRRKSHLGAVQSCKVLRSLNTRLQVRIARGLRRFSLQASATAHKQVFTAGSSEQSQFAMLIIESGCLEVLTVDPQGEEVIIGRVGPGSIVGGLRALGLVGAHLLSVRVPMLVADGRAAAGELAASSEVSGYMITGAELREIQSESPEEMAQFSRRIMQDVRLKILPRVSRAMSQGSFFRRYQHDFVRSLARDLDFRLCKPGELIFKEKSPAHSLAILFAGAIDIYVQDGLVSERLRGCGLEFGEAALLDTGSIRSATVRCSTAGECLICLLHADVFEAAFEEFPEERQRLEEQVRTRLTQIALKDADSGRFRNVDPKFVQLLSTFGEVVHTGWGKWACEAGEGEEAMHIVYMGRASVERSDGLGESEMLVHGGCIGLEAALGFRSGPPNYRLVAGRHGCTFIRLDRAAFRRTFVHFPTTYQAVLSSFDPPLEAEDPEVARSIIPSEPLMWQNLLDVFNQALGTTEFRLEQLKALRSCMEVVIYEPGVTVTEEGKYGRSMMLLMDGTVRWSRSGIVDVLAEAPRHFDEGILMGVQVKHSATIVAKTTCVVWQVNLPATAPTAASGRRKSRVVRKSMAATAEAMGPLDATLWTSWNAVKEAGAQRTEMLNKLQARLRNMKTFRRFRSEILALICENLQIRTFLPGQHVFCEGDAAECVYIVLKGRAEARAHGKTNLLEEGSTFGEMVLFGQATRSATVTALSLCICNAVYKDFITHAFMLFPDERGPATAGSSATSLASGLGDVAPPLSPPGETSAVPAASLSRRVSMVGGMMPLSARPSTTEATSFVVEPVAERSGTAPLVQGETPRRSCLTPLRSGETSLDEGIGARRSMRFATLAVDASGQRGEPSSGSSSPASPASPTSPTSPRTPGGLHERRASRRSLSTRKSMSVITDELRDQTEAAIAELLRPELSRKTQEGLGTGLGQGEASDGCQYYSSAGEGFDAVAEEADGPGEAPEEAPAESLPRATEEAKIMRGLASLLVRRQSYLSASLQALEPEARAPALDEAAAATRIQARYRGGRARKSAPQESEALPAAAPAAEAASEPEAPLDAASVVLAAAAAAIEVLTPRGCGSPEAEDEAQDEAGGKAADDAAVQAAVQAAVDAEVRSAEVEAKAQAELPAALETEVAREAAAEIAAAVAAAVGFSLQAPPSAEAAEPAAAAAEAEAEAEVKVEDRLAAGARPAARARDERAEVAEAVAASFAFVAAVVAVSAAERSRLAADASAAPQR